MRFLPKFTSTLSCSVALAAVLASVTWAQESPILKAVEPEWQFAADEQVVSAPMSVELIVLPNGMPYEVYGEGRLPVELLRALANYEMRPNTKAYSTRFLVEVKESIDNVAAGGRWAGDVSRLQDAVAQMDAAKAAAMEMALTDDATSLDARSVLVLWAAGKGENREIRARQVAWLVEHAPEAEVLRHPSAWIDGGADADSNPQAYARIRQLWLDRIRSGAASPKVIGAAAMFLRVRDPQIAESLLQSAANASYLATPVLGEVYALAALGVPRLDAKTGNGVAPASPVRIGDFGSKARAVLAESTDVWLLHGARFAMQLMRSSTEADIPGFEALCADVIRQLKLLQKSAPDHCGGANPEPAPDLPSPVRVRPAIAAASVVRQPRPAYPDEWRKRGIQGRVKFTAIIGRDGRIKKLNLVSGLLPLVAAAYDAVSQWEYRPTRINGEAVEVLTDIEFNFTLN